MDKRDIGKELKHLYLASAGKVVEVDMPTMNYLMADGEGDPNTSQAFSDSVEALFAVSYAIKFMVKKGPLAIDYGVMPLEGLWWAEDMSAFTAGDKSHWKWTLMILQPTFVTREIVEAAMAEVTRKKNPTAISRLHLEAFEEGRCAQILHVGPFSEEGPSIDKLHRFIDSRSQRIGKHHEIYLSDMRKAAPANWKTIIRQPMR